VRNHDLLIGQARAALSPAPVCLMAHRRSSGALLVSITGTEHPLLEGNALKLRLLTSTAAALAMLVLTVPASATASPRRLGGDSGNAFKVRPGQIQFHDTVLGGEGWTASTGPDGRLASFGRIAWSKYNQREAIGSGIYWVSDCVSGCFNGTYRAHTATVHAISVKGDRYRRLTIRFRYNGQTRYDRRILRRHGTYWAWDIVG
jgi:hypothetical protein